MGDYAAPFDVPERDPNPPKAWPGRPGVEHVGGGFIQFNHDLAPIPEGADDPFASTLAALDHTRGFLGSDDLEPLEGPSDDAWGNGWDAGYAQAEDEARALRRHSDEAREVRSFILQLALLATVIVVITCVTILLYQGAK